MVNGPDDLAMSLVKGTMSLISAAACAPARAGALAARRTSEGLSKREIIRCLKRYVAREVYDGLVA